MRLILLNEIADEDESLRHQWNDLVLRLDDPQVFYTYEWSLAVQRAYGATLRPMIFLGYDESKSLCGIVSLALDTEGTRASFLCATTGDYCDFLSLPQHRNVFLSAVLMNLRERGISELTLTNLPADSTTVTALQKNSAIAGYRFFARTAYICAQVLLSGLERQAPNNKVVLPGKKMVRRSLTALGKEAPVRLDHARTWAAIAPILPAFAEAHVLRFSATNRTSNLSRPERRLFLEELARLLSHSGSVVLTRMMSGEKIIAWNYGFQFQGTWFWYQPTFDTDLERYSPGFCLLTKLIEEAVEDPALKVVDLGLGAEEYKERFANRSRETLYVTLRSSMSKHVKEILRYRTAEIVKASPRLEASARRIVTRLRRPRVPPKK